MALSTPSRALGSNDNRRSSLDTFHRRGGFNLWSDGSSPSRNRSSRTGTSSSSTLGSSPLVACSPRPSSAKTKAKLLSPVAIYHNFQAQYHRHGECLAHPSGWGCDCEKVQLPTMESSAAWDVMGNRFKAVEARRLRRLAMNHSPAVRVEKVLSSPSARSTGPAVLAVPKLKLPAEKSASRAVSHRTPRSALQYDNLISASPRHAGVRGAKVSLPQQPSESPRGVSRTNLSRAHSSFFRKLQGLFPANS